MSSKPVLKLKGEKGDVAVVEDEKGECGAEEEDVCETQESLGLESFTEPASPDVPAVASTSSHVCALRSCRRSLEDKSRVRIKAHPSPPAPDPKALVVWEPSGYAEFHRECWEVFDFNSFNGIRPRLRLKCSRKELAVLKVSAKTAEHFDAPCVFSTKARKAAELIRTAKHCVVFTGAAAGIQDWRGPDGVWTKKEFDKGKGKAGSGNDEKEDDEGDGGGDEEEGSKSTSSSSVDYNAFRPTLTHEAIAHLLELGYVKHVISQNVDGLHLLSGIPLENLSELHGNAFVEQCPNCGFKAISPRYVPTSDLVMCGKNHKTGIRCPRCRRCMEDNIVCFSDKMDNEVLQTARRHAKECDVMVCLGSSFMVQPACSMVALGKPKIIICNRQHTRWDSTAEKTETCVRGDCDDFMKTVMETILGEEGYAEWTKSVTAKKLLYDVMRDPSTQLTVLHEPERKRMKRTVQRK